MGDPGGDGGKPPPMPGGAAKAKERETVIYEEYETYDSYKLIIQSKRNSADQSIPFIPMQKVGKMMESIVSVATDVRQVMRLNRSKLLITCANAKTANEIVTDIELKKLYDAFIPFAFVNRVAILRDIDEEFDDEEIKNSINAGPFQVVSVQRLNRRISAAGAQPEYAKSRSIKVVFRGQDIPTHVFLYYCKIDCAPFIQRVVQCFQCSKFGHITKMCRSKKVCKRCYTPMDDEENHQCSSATEVKCVNCDGSHTPRDDACPEMKRQKELKMLMSTRRMVFQEASKAVPRVNANKSYSIRTQNSFAALSQMNEEFPRVFAFQKSPLEDPIRKYVPKPLTYVPSKSLPSANKKIMPNKNSFNRNGNTKKRESHDGISAEGKKPRQSSPAIKSKEDQHVPHKNNFHMETRTETSSGVHDENLSVKDVEMQMTKLSTETSGKSYAKCVNGNNPNNLMLSNVFSPPTQNSNNSTNNSDVNNFDQEMYSKQMPSPHLGY